MARPRKTKAAEVKEAAVKEAAVEVKETAEVVETTEVKEETAEAVEAAEVKEEVKKAPAKKAAKKEVVPFVMVQFGGQEVAMDTIIENVKKVFVAEGHKSSTIKELQVYVKPEENAAYYVINGGKYTGKADLF